ncbi:hypothetical protein BKA64DRAFT_262981 [Cadophora sp. MPI-SDFR-AT-0126]|nr:hypothetical protein BKA64DRAFT_262981 [Leotiomycetes sp. MPI-SDFR-AT-0126]
MQLASLVSGGFGGTLAGLSPAGDSMRSIAQRVSPRGNPWLQGLAVSSAPPFSLLHFSPQQRQKQINHKTVDLAALFRCSSRENNSAWMRSSSRVIKPLYATKSDMTPLNAALRSHLQKPEVNLKPTAEPLFSAQADGAATCLIVPARTRTKNSSLSDHSMTILMRPILSAVSRLWRSFVISEHVETFGPTLNLLPAETQTSNSDLGKKRNPPFRLKPADWILGLRGDFSRS